MVLWMLGCGDNNSPLFTRLDEKQTNITFQNTLFEGESLNILNYPYFYNGGGVAIGDINNDGLQDILFTGNMVKNRLYLNKGDFKFENITAQTGIAKEQGWCTGATMVDINHDGKIDIYICRSADINSNRRKNLLFINEGNLKFTEKAEEYGLADIGYSTQASFFDYDKDGDLDCFIINHSLQKYSAGEQYDPSLRKRRNPNFASKLYRNNDGQYTDVSEKAGITSNVLTSGLGLAISDLNNDGWPDIYVSNDYNEPDYLFINQANGTFSEELSQRMDQVSLYSMGSDIADYNNDGFTDVITLDMLPEDNKSQKMHNGSENFDKFQNIFNHGFFYQYSRNMLQKNNGDGSFSEIGQLAGISSTDWSWSALFCDFNNDGSKDLFITNGYVRDYTNMDFINDSVDQVLKAKTGKKMDGLERYIAKMPPNPVPNYLFQNKGNGSFIDHTKDWGLDRSSISSGAAYADLDNDGDMDLVINNINSDAGIYRNNSEISTNNNYLKIRLNSGGNNVEGIGAKVILYCDKKSYKQEAFVSRGFQSSVDPVLNFGIGKSKLVDSVRIIWPTDSIQTLRQIKANQLLTVKAVNAKRNETLPAHHQTYFRTKTLPSITHNENRFNDFNIQTLLPNYLSRQGPCITVADVNKDGLDDFFMGGAKNHPSELYIQDINGTFNKKSEKAFAQDVISEDVAADFFDADGDGDLDLYVGSGGYEFNEDDVALRDRLYVNDGRGNFAKKEKAVPQLLFSKGCVKAADIDDDGDNDIFVGGRVIPGAYPLAPYSKILLNDGEGNLTDATLRVAPDLQNLGMVTDAVWMNINNDEFPDLIVVGEWMPIKVFINHKGKLVDTSNKYIKFASSGWWNTLYAEDMDNDGDQDLVIGNCGMNNQFLADETEPITLVYKDFDQNGSVDPILCYFVKGISYPAAFRDDLMEQLPFLKKDFLSYHDYANATVNDLFSADQLKDAGLLKAEMMQTIYLENQGAKGFLLHNLPKEAQYGPVYGIASMDANGDGKKDLLLAGNNTWTRIKFGRYNANHGILLTGDGRGKFDYVPQFKSGLNIKGNVRSVAKIKREKGEQIILGLNASAAVELEMNLKNGDNE